MRSSPVLAALAGVPLVCSPFIRAGKAGELRTARQLVLDSGVKGGLVVHVGCGDAKGTVDLRTNDRYLVQGLERDERLVDEARRRLFGGGLLGPVSIRQWRGGALPYADNLVNLLIVEDGQEVAEHEINRVLAPRGIAYVRKGESWRRLVKPWPDAIDEWTHFLHGPDNNAVAEDTRIAPPHHLQWTAPPRWGRSHDHLGGVSAAVSAAGRIFYIIDEVEFVVENSDSESISQSSGRPCWFGYTPAGGFFIGRTGGKTALDPTGIARNGRSIRIQLNDNCLGGDADYVGKHADPLQMAAGGR